MTARFAIRLAILSYTQRAGWMDGAFIESQYIETFGISDKEFEHNYRVDIANPAAGFLPGAVQVGLDDSSAELQALLNEEHSQLVEDRPSKLHLHSRSRILEQFRLTREAFDWV